MTCVVPIVEGHGEIDAVPALLHRIRDECRVSAWLQVEPPIRIKSGSLLNDDAYFRKHILLAAAKAAQKKDGNRWVLILLDCEDACPAELGPRLLERAQAVRPDVDYLIALAYREYESWFLAAAASLRGECGLPGDLVPPADIDHIRDAKGWLNKRMSETYDPIIHQCKFTRAFDLRQARAASRSFDRLYRKAATLLGASADPVNCGVQGNHSPAGGV
jgi:hypothetical protein